MLTFSHKGRLGNTLFQAASCIGLAKKHGHGIEFPYWDEWKYFKGPFKICTESHFKHIQEAGFEYNDIIIPAGSVMLNGYLQSERYWANAQKEVWQMLSFKEDFITGVKEKNATALQNSPIAISIRRGDFVNNPVYFQTPIGYYISALETHFPDWQGRNVILFSDDIQYCKFHFSCLPNAYFAEGTAIEQLCLITLCDDFIISNSTFSWWGAYLANTGKVIRPEHNFGEEYRKTHPEHDFWPSKWIAHAEQKLDLSDATFIIPVFHDHTHRRDNMELCIALLLHDFNTNIIVGEQGGQMLSYTRQYVRYVQFMGMGEFHRTRMLNRLIALSDTPYFFNYDADMLTPPMQLLEAVKRLRAGADCVYPYDGRFAHVDRQHYSNVVRLNDSGALCVAHGTSKSGGPMAISSVGGAMAYNKKIFISGGMENEKMISYGPEDCERWDRFRNLGYDVQRVSGIIYHMNHWRGHNSANTNKYFRANHDEYEKVKEMSKKELKEYVATWYWLK